MVSSFREPLHYISLVQELTESVGAGKIKCSREKKTYYELENILNISKSIK